MSLWSKLFGRGTHAEEWREVRAEEQREDQRTYTLGVVGESFDNDDGTPRQRIIRQCKSGDPIALRREPDNPYDPNAIAVTTAAGEQIGYLSRHNAEWVSDVLEKTETTAVIKSISPAEGAPELLGVVIDLTLHYRE